MARGEGRYATVAISRGIFEDLVEKWPDFEDYMKDFRYNERVKMPIRFMTEEQMQYLVKRLNEEGTIGIAAQVQGFINAMNKGGVIDNLKKMEAAITAWVRKNAIRGWIYRIEDELPELLVDVEYHYATEDYPAFVSIETCYIACNNNRGNHKTIHASSCGKSIDRVMIELGYVHEDKALNAQYEKLEAKYLEWRAETGRQYVHKETGEKLVNDTDSPIETHTVRRYGNEWEEGIKEDPKNVKYRHANKMFRRVKNKDDDGDGVDGVDAQYTQIPVHPFLFFFNLKSHKFGWHNVRDVSPYTFNPAVKNRLILPEGHRNLIDALTTDLSIVAEDIVADKVGGVTILCQGRPGTGKTLTAEVYSEVVQKPLYRVHSGQLGTEPQGLESMLQKSMERAARWNAVLLIDEADVFLMQRTDDLTRNAVVGVFLRTLEYYRGLLILTTNRLDAIDDAIISRCIAVIKYENPGPDERLAIWRTQLDLSGVELPDELVKELADYFEASGRDIKGLVRLTTRYCRVHNKSMDFDDFLRMAAFRGL